jgi:O-antigen ligase
MEDEAPRFLNRPGAVERTLVFLMLFLYAWGTPLEWVDFVEEGATESSLLTQALFLAFFVHTIVALNGNWHVALRAAKGEPLVPAFVGLAFVSAIWSTVPADTFSDGLVLIVAYVTALHLVVRFSVEEIVGFIAAYEAFDSLTLSTDGGSESGWRGITPNKNTLGRAGVLGYIVAVVHARSIRSWFLWPGLAGLNAILVVGSNSGTALGALFGISALSIVFLGFRGRKTLYGATMVAMAVVFSTLTALAATNLAAATGLLGKDSSFTGRLPIWTDSFTYGVRERPWLGYGRGGFWRHGIADFEVQIRTNNFDTPHAHNAWVDAWLELGPFGVILVTAIILRGLFWSTRRIRAVPTAIGMFPAAVISLAVIYSTTEAGFITRSVQFIMFVVALTEAARQKSVEQPFEGSRSRGSDAKDLAADQLLLS